MDPANLIDRLVVAAISGGLGFLLSEWRHWRDRRERATDQADSAHRERLRAEADCSALAAAVQELCEEQQVAAALERIAGLQALVHRLIG